MDHTIFSEASPTSPVSYTLSRIRPRQPVIGVPEPDEDDYPGLDAIREAFLGTGLHETVMFTEIGDSLPARFFAFLEHKKTYRDAYPDEPESYCSTNGRSFTFYQRFADRYCLVFSERASGVVFLLSSWPYGPVSDCSCWARIEFPALKLNPAVTAVVMVNYLNYFQRKVYWTRDDDDLPNRVRRGDDDPNGGSRRLRWPRQSPPPGPSRPALPRPGPVGGGPNPMAVLGGAGALIPALTTPLGAGMLPPGVSGPPFPPQGYDPTQRGKLRPRPLDKSLQDILPMKNALMPDSENSDIPTFINNAADPNVPSPQIGEGGDKEQISNKRSWWSQTSKRSFLGTTSTTTTSQYSKRDLSLQPRTPQDGKCFDWAGYGDDPAANALIPYDVPPNEGALDPKTYAAKLEILGAQVSFARVSVTQYRKNDPDQNPSENYALDISITIPDSHGQTVGSLNHVSAPDGQWIKVQSSLPYALFVATQSGDDDDRPLKFRYGELGTGNDLWDGSATGEPHDCKFDPWKSGIRQGTCDFQF